MDAKLYKMYCLVSCAQRAKLADRAMLCHSRSLCATPGMLLLAAWSPGSKQRKPQEPGSELTPPIMTHLELYSWARGSYFADFARFARFVFPSTLLITWEQMIVEQLVDYNARIVCVFGWEPSDGVFRTSDPLPRFPNWILVVRWRAWTDSSHSS